jgi:hypothetical protein
MALSLKSLNNIVYVHPPDLEEVYFITWNILNSNIYFLHNFKMLFLVDNIVSFSWIVNVYV